MSDKKTILIITRNSIIGTLKSHDSSIELYNPLEKESESKLLRWYWKNHKEEYLSGRDPECYLAKRENPTPTDREKQWIGEGKDSYRSRYMSFYHLLTQSRFSRKEEIDHFVSDAEVEMMALKDEIYKCFETKDYRVFLFLYWGEEGFNEHHLPRVFHEAMPDLVDLICQDLGIDPEPEKNLLLMHDKEWYGTFNTEERVTIDPQSRLAKYFGKARAFQHEDNPAKSYHYIVRQDFDSLRNVFRYEKAHDRFAEGKLTVEGARDLILGKASDAAPLPPVQ